MEKEMIKITQNDWWWLLTRSTVCIMRLIIIVPSNLIWFRKWCLSKSSRESLTHFIVHIPFFFFPFSFILFSFLSCLADILPWNNYLWSHLIWMRWKKDYSNYKTTKANPFILLCLKYTSDTCTQINTKEELNMLKLSIFLFFFLHFNFFFVSFVFQWYDVSKNKSQ